MSWTGAGIGAAIGTLFGGPVGAGVGAAIGSMFGNDDEEHIEEEYEKLKLKIKQTVLEYEDGTKGNFFVLKIKGNLTVPSNDYAVKTTVEIFDTTDEVEKIVYTNNEAYNAKGDGTFYVKGENTIPYDVSSFDNIEVEQIHIDSLIFPRKGERKLVFKYTIVDGLTGKNIKVLFKAKTYYSNIDGYEDMQENKPAIEKLMIEMAFIMSNIDGTIDESERQIVANMGKRMIEEDYPEEERAKNKKRLNEYISSAYKAAKDKKLNAQTVLNAVNKICTIDVKYLMFDTCLDVAAADGVADKDELELVYYMALKLDLDKDECKKMIEKKLPITMHNEDDLEHTFAKNIGITSGMSSLEIGAILRKEFKKWNQRVANADPVKREQAELMLHKIAELRKKYKN